MNTSIQEACKKFLEDFPDYEQVTWDNGEIVLCRPGSTEPFVMGEYKLGTRTRKAFEELADLFEGLPDFVYKHGSCVRSCNNCGGSGRKPTWQFGNAPYCRVCMGGGWVPAFDESAAR